MNSKLAVGIIALSFIVTLFIGNMIMLYAHESSHAIVLIAAGIPFDFSVPLFGIGGTSHAQPLAPMPETTYQIFNLAGGIGAAVVMGLLFLLVTYLEKRSKKNSMILGAIGAQIVFLYFVFYGIINAIEEGFLTGWYQNWLNDPTPRVFLIVPSLAISVAILIKLKLNTVKHAVAVETL